MALWIHKKRNNNCFSLLLLLPFLLCVFFCLFFFLRFFSRVLYFISFHHRISIIRFSFRLIVFVHIVFLLRQKCVDTKEEDEKEDEDEERGGGGGGGVAKRKPT